MIYKLQRKFILISTISLLSVIALIFGVILVLNVTTMNRNMDILADSVSEGRGRFPQPFDDGFKPGDPPPNNDKKFDFISPETPFSTRHFTVFYDKLGNVEKTFTESIYSITDDQAIDYAERVNGEIGDRGWISNYRYKVFKNGEGIGIVFIDGSVNRVALMQSTTIAGLVLLSCAALVLILIISLSKNAVRPISESYEKQKQFITDANHELKTPLTLILTNLDIAESELGKNEWLEDIRAEGHRMTELVNQLVALSRMDEDGQTLNMGDVYIGELVYDTVAEFETLAKDRGKTVYTDIDRGLTYNGDESLLYRLVGILMDNAIKYCDNGGEINVTLHRGRHIVLTVENSYAAVSEIKLDCLFDRFYRADKARKFTGGYGLGLSMAKAIVEKHKGEISAYKKDENHIGFKVVL